ncbi:Coenzyme F420 hydrogenase/dehydrogenase, beta subunit C-terminal domain [Weeksellaceae bacterium A-14]
MKKISLQKIVESELCTGCGACVEDYQLKMQWNKNGFLVPDWSNNPEKFEKQIHLCPFNPDDSVNNEDQLAEEFFKETKEKDLQIGKFQQVYAGYSNDYRNTSSSGGIATFVFEKLLKNKIVDHLFIVKEVEGSYQYQWFEDWELIQETSKTRYIPVTLAELFKEINQKEGKVAVSGVACFIKAIRLKQHYHPELKEKIPFLIGIICGGLKSQFFTDYLSQKCGIKGDYHQQQYRIKDRNSSASDYSFGAYDSKNEFHQMKMKTVGDMWGTGLFKSKACDFCDDVTTELADISLGDAWISPYSKDGLGNSVIVTRTLFADKMIQEGIASQRLNCHEISLELLKKSQAGSFKHRQLGMRYRLKVLQKEKGIILNKRKRFLQRIPFEFRIVQKERMKLREQSLTVWKNAKNAKIFETELLPLKEKLKSKTLFYHRMQKLRRILKLKTL